MLIKLVCPTNEAIVELIKFFCTSVRNHLTLRMRLKQLTCRTIYFSESVMVLNTTINHFIDQFFSAAKDR
ncbi:IS1 family transposase [Spirosoma pomorum]